MSYKQADKRTCSLVFCLLVLDIISIYLHEYFYGSEKDSLMKLFSLIIVVGIALLAFAGYSYTQEQNFLARAESTMGVVADYKVQREDGANETNCPIIQFNSRDGQNVIFSPNVCTSAVSYEIGQQVEVLYDPFNLNWIQLNTFGSKYTEIIVTFLIGLVTFILGVWGMSARRAKRNK